MKKQLALLMILSLCVTGCDKTSVPVSGSNKPSAPESIAPSVSKPSDVKPSDTGKTSKTSPSLPKPVYSSSITQDELDEISLQYSARVTETVTDSYPEEYEMEPEVSYTITDIQVSKEDYSFQFWDREMDEDFNYVLPDTSKEASLESYYAPNPADEVSSVVYLTIDNKLNYEEMTNFYEGKNDKISFEEAGFGNAFDRLYPEDFIRVDEESTEGKEVFRLDLEGLEDKSIATHIGSQLSHGIGDPVVEFKLITDGYHVRGFTAKLADMQSDITGGMMASSMEGEFTGFGDAVSVRKVLPLDGEEDKTFEDAMKKLSLGNFTLDGEIYTIPGDGLRKTADIHAISANDSFTYQTLDKNRVMESYCYYKDGDNKVSSAFYTGEEYIQNKYYQNSSFQGGLLPSFGISSKFFTHEEGSKRYYFKGIEESGIVGNDIYSRFCNYNSSITYVDNLIITIDGDKVTFESYGLSASGNLCDYDKLVYSDIGTTTTSLDKNSITPISQDMTFDDILKYQTKPYRALSSSNRKLLKKIPLLSGYTVYNVTVIDDSTLALIAFLNPEETKKIDTDYQALLAEKGYTKTNGKHYLTENGSTIEIETAYLESASQYQLAFHFSKE